MGATRANILATPEECMAQDANFFCGLPNSFKSDAAIAGSGVLISKSMFDPSCAKYV
jgi:hypothetical protein